MIRTTATYQNGRLELRDPIELEEGARVGIAVYPVEDEGWMLLGFDRLEKAWTNTGDAIYDDWRRLYNVDPV